MAIVWECTPHVRRSSTPTTTSSPARSARHVALDPKTSSGSKRGASCFESPAARMQAVRLIGAQRVRVSAETCPRGQGGARSTTPERFGDSAHPTSSGSLRHSEGSTDAQASFCPSRGGRSPRHQAARCPLRCRFARGHGYRSRRHENACCLHVQTGSRGGRSRCSLGRQRIRVTGRCNGRGNPSRPCAGEAM